MEAQRILVVDDEPRITDLVSMALLLGASFVARGFSGDKGQLVPLIKAAIRHRGAAFIDCISPCVAFNNHPGSTKSYDYVREHNEAVNALDVMVPRTEIIADYQPGAVEEVTQHDGSVLRLRKLAEDYDPTDRLAAMAYVQEAQAAGDLNARMNTVELPLNTLGTAELCPGSAAIEAINASLR